MLICNVEANYQFATLQSCFIICSRLNFFCVLVPPSDIWLLYNRGCFASVFFITSCAGDIELLDLPRTGPHLTLIHVRMVPWSPTALTVFLFGCNFCLAEKERDRWQKHWGESDQSHISQHSKLLCRRSTVLSVLRVFYWDSKWTEERKLWF